MRRFTLLCLTLLSFAACAPKTAAPESTSESSQQQALSGIDLESLGKGHSATAAFCKIAQGCDIDESIQLIDSIGLGTKYHTYVAKTLGLNDTQAFVDAWESESRSETIQAMGVNALDLQRAFGYVLIFEKLAGEDIARKALATGFVKPEQAHARVNAPYLRDIVKIPGKLTKRGSLEMREGVSCLKLKGSDAERGYAQGCLMGREIVRVLQHMAGDIVYLMSAQKTYQQIRDLQYTSFDFADCYRRELAGMLKGINETVPQADRLIGGRTIDLVDLQALNTVSDWIRFGCSTFTIFGSLAKKTGPVAVRNLDYIVDSGEMTSAYPTMIAHVPTDDDRHAWLSATWPGLIGLYSGMNDEGAVLLLHDANGRGDRRIGLVPRSLAARDVIEGVGSGEDAVEDAAIIFRSRLTYAGCNFHFVAPDDKGGVVAAVFEYDGRYDRDEGVTVRKPGKSGEEGDYLICTNHYCLREGASRMFHSTTQRYSKLEKALKQHASDGTSVQVSELRGLIRSVEMDATVVKTLHTTFAYPLDGIFDVAFATSDEPAPHRNPLRFETSEWLER